MSLVCGLPNRDRLFRVIGRFSRGSFWRRIPLRSVHNGRIGGYVGGGHRAFIGRAFYASSAFRHDNHLFFRPQFHRFFPASNVVAFGLPVWYPSYYYSDPDGYLENDNDSTIRIRLSVLEQFGRATAIGTRHTPE